MYTPHLSKKYVKNFCTRLRDRLLQGGIDAPYPLVLEAYAAGAQVRDWNTLVASLPLEGTQPSTQSPLSPVLPTARKTYEWQPLQDSSAAFELYRPGLGVDIAWRPRPGDLDIVIGKPGCGKSTMVNLGNLDFCLDAPPGGPPPRLAMLDMGGVGRNVFHDIAQGMPGGKGGQDVCYLRFCMERACAVNVFDTPAGCRYPSARHRDFLVEFVQLLVTDDDEEYAHPTMRQVARHAIDRLYARYCDVGAGAMPRLYEAGLDAGVDQAIVRSGIRTGADTTWWSVVDALFARGEPAMIAAQRHAVPMVEDLIQVVNIAEIVDIFGNATAPNSESLLRTFQRMINAALKAYPVLRGPTQLDLGGARIAAIHIHEVALAGSGLANKQTDMVYMLASWLLTTSVFPEPMQGGKGPEQYHTYHLAIEQRLQGAPGRFVVDEYHRFCSTTHARNWTMSMVDDGIKRCRNTVLVTQSSSSVSTAMYSKITGLWTSPDMSSDSFQTKDMQALLKEVYGGRYEARVMAYPHTSDGAFAFMTIHRRGGLLQECLVKVSVPAQHLWLCNRNAEDAILVDELQLLVGKPRALQSLATRFARGTARPELWALLAASTAFPPVAMRDIIKALAADMAAHPLD